MLETAVARATAAGDTRAALHARLPLTGLQVDERPELGTESLRAEAEAALRTFDELGDDVGLAKAWRRLGVVHGVASRWRLAAEAFERALHYARRAGETRDATVSASMLLYALFYGPAPVDEAMVKAEEICAASANEPSVEAAAAAALAGLHAMRGDFGRGRELAQSARRRFEELGQMRRIAEAAFVTAAVELLAGDAAAAARHLRDTYDSLTAKGEMGAASSLATEMAEALYRLGDDDEAERMTEVAEECAGEDDLFSQIKWRAVRAKVLARRGALDVAVPLAVDAAERAASTDALDMSASARLDLAEVLRAAGDDAEAAAAAAAAAELYARKGNEVGARRARALLDALRQPARR